jgi:cell division inhibitor SulA
VSEQENTPAVQLDDPGRVVEVVSAAGIEWETTGRAGQVAGWLGNATEHDRREVMRAAQLAALAGECLRVSFTSVITFFLVHQGSGVYAISVPEQD